MERPTQQYNALKQKEYNFKLQEQSLKEQYQANYKKFNIEYQGLRKTISVMEGEKESLKNEAEMYHSAMMKHKEQSRGVHLKYKQLKQEYEGLQSLLEERDRKYEELKRKLEQEAIPSITRYKEKAQLLMDEIERLKSELEQRDRLLALNRSVHYRE